MLWFIKLTKNSIFILVQYDCGHVQVLHVTTKLIRLEHNLTYYCALKTNKAPYSTVLAGPQLSRPIFHASRSTPPTPLSDYSLSTFNAHLTDCGIYV